MNSMPDILMIGAVGADGDTGAAPAPAQPDFTGQPPAQGGTYVEGACNCADNGLAGGAGNSGNIGDPGMPGQKPATLGFIVGRLLSDIALTSQGGAGGKGGTGSNGSDGGAGQDSGTNDPKCLKSSWTQKACCPPATGGVGGNAGNGANGGPGGAGGDGGDIYIYYTEPQGGVYQIIANTLAGQVGVGGDPGQAGQPGIGGLNESGTPPRSASGSTASDGGHGPNGNPPGEPGVIIVHNLASAAATA